MRIGSLFTGAGGLDLAVAAVFGGDVVWHAEIDKAASKVLAYRFPGVPNLGDITDIDWADVEPVDVLCGGFPCQDVSAAGKRAGIKQGTRSGLWSVFADAIDALRPQWVVIENVRGLLSAAAHRAGEDDEQSGDVESGAAVVGDGAGRPVLRAAGAVLGDLADLGYDAQWATVAAADVGAPHRRERVFILATATDPTGCGYRLDGRPIRGRGLHEPSQVQEQPPCDVGAVNDRPRHGGEVLAHDWSWEYARAVRAERDREETHLSLADISEGRRGVPAEPDVERIGGTEACPCCGDYDGDEEPAIDGEQEWIPVGTSVGGSDAAVSGDEPGVALLPTPTAQCAKHGADSRFGGGNGDVSNLWQIAHLLPTPRSSDCFGAGHHGDGGMDLRTTVSLLPTPRVRHGDSSESGLRKNSPGIEAVTYHFPDAHWGKYAPAIARWESLTRPAPAPTEPNKNGNPRLSAAFSEWLLGWPDGWVTDPAIGISRNDQLRIVGNGVCSQQAAAALRYLLSLAAGSPAPVAAPDGRA